jgi:heat shock protein HtpX
MVGLIEHRATRERRAALLLGGFGLVGGAVVWLVIAVAGWTLVGLVLGVVVAIGLAVRTARRGEAFVLRQIRAEPADLVTHARFANLVDGLCSASGVPRPALYVVDHPALNALATARSPRHSSLAATTGLLEGLSRIELEGVVAHELTRIKAGDALVSTVASATAGRLPAWCDWAFGVVGRGTTSTSGVANDSGGGRAILGWVLAGPALLSAQILRRGLDPERELDADLATARLTRYPPGLLAALEKIAAADEEVPRQHAVAHLWLRSPLARPAPDGWPLGFLDRAVAMGDSLPRRIEALREL